MFLRSYQADFQYRQFKKQWNLHVMTNSAWTILGLLSNFDPSKTADFSLPGRVTTTHLLCFVVPPV